MIADNDDMPRPQTSSPYWRDDRRCYYGTYYDETGRRRRVRLDPDYDVSVRMLSRLRDEVERIRLGVVTRAEIDLSIRGGASIADVLAECLAELAGARRSAGYIREMRETVDRFARASGVRRIDQITTAMIERHLADMLRRGLSTETRNKAATRISTFLAWAVDRGYLRTNPAGGIKRVRGDGGRDRPRALTHDELRALLETCRDPRRRLAYLLGARAGLRVHEAHRVTMRHLDADAGWIRLDETVTKEGRGAELPMHEMIRDALTHLRRTSGPVCGPVPSRYTWLRDLHRAGIVGVCEGVRSGNWSESDLIGYRDDRGCVLSRRSLRHTYGTHLAASGATPQVVAKLMRHTDPSLSLRYYTDARLMDLRGAVDRLDLGAAGGQLGASGGQMLG